MFVAVATCSTGTTGIARINDDHLHASQCRLVLHELSQLVKRPTVEATALRTLKRCSIPNMYQCFEGECLAFFRRLRDQAFADSVVGVLLKAAFFAAIALQSTFGAFRADSLQALTSQVGAFTYAINLCTAECVTVTGGSKIDDPKIDADHAHRFIGFWQLLRLRDAQIPRIALADQFRATDLPAEIVQVAALEIAKIKLHHHATVQRIQRDLIALHQAIGAGIVADRSISPESGTGGIAMLATSADRFGGFVARTARELRAQPKLGTSCAIDDVMQRVFIRNALLARDGCAKCGSSVERRLRFTQRRISRVVNTQFTANRSCGKSITHKRGIAHLYLFCKQMFGEWHFLRQLKQAVSVPVFL